MAAADSQWDDSLWDAVSAVECVRAGDIQEGLRVIVDNADLYALTVTLVKLMAECCDELDVSPGHWRAWAEQADRRS
ncbi:MAG: hypothetical protein JO345_34510 [Streptosporangiaceae bacterium]|nr:hypothetical protein [Streptosporangiaceae bacterium]